jgi:hypothetical protein
VDAIRAQGDSVADQLAQASDSARSAVAAYSNEVLNHTMATGAQTVEALRAESERVADQLAQASSATRSATVKRDVVSRDPSSPDLIADRLPGLSGGGWRKLSLLTMPTTSSRASGSASGQYQRSRNPLHGDSIV